MENHLLLAMFSPQDICLILIVAVFLFGPKRLPEIGEAFGKTIQSFKGAVSDNKGALAGETHATETKQLPPQA